MNGKVGVVVETKEGHDRVGVRFEDCSRVKGIKTTKLRKDIDEAFPGTGSLDYGLLYDRYSTLCKWPSWLHLVSWVVR